MQKSKVVLIDCLSTLAHTTGLNSVSIECVRAVWSWNASLSTFWDKELGVWLGLWVYGIEDAMQWAQQISNGVEEARSHRGVDGSQLEKAESP
jgi:hypothetical protein